MDFRYFKTITVIKDIINIIEYNWWFKIYSYFEIQAKMGMTKHIGGLESTKKLLEYCKIDSSKYVLVVGSGNGISAIRIARLTGCKVIGIDISSEMVKNANEKKEEGIEFRVGDAEKLHFPDNTFDVVLSESVTSFTNKERSLKEYHRVLKNGGYIGLNEVTWLKDPSYKIAAYALGVMDGLNPARKRGWISLIERSGFKCITSEVNPMNKIGQFIGELQMHGMGIFKIWLRFFSLYFFDKEYRKSVHKLAKDSLRMPKGFMHCFGSGIYIGIKH